VNPQKWNQYSYVLNNPLIKVDPDGAQDFNLSYAGGTMDQLFLMRMRPAQRAQIEQQRAREVRAQTPLAVASAGALAVALTPVVLVELAPLATSAGAALVRARDAVSGGLAELSEAASAGAVKLTVGTLGRLNSAINAVEEHFTNSDISGAVKQAATGIEAGGDHMKELTDTANSLTNLGKSLKGALDNPDLDDETRQLYTQTLEQIQRAVQKIKDLQN